MSEAKHTPGPWFQSHRRSIGGYSTEVYIANGEVIATVAWYPRRLNETTTVTDREANACLIAAAPELLAALKAATDALAGGLWDYGPGQDEHEKCNEVIEACRAVIAKATQ